MDIEKFTERARGFIQSAQSLALREGHQQFTPEHLLKVLIDDEEGLALALLAIDDAGLIDPRLADQPAAQLDREATPGERCAA